jgi:flavin reductase (DIM6/NTAB) family NADH-FMN oxidoreductase RutF
VSLDPMLVLVCLNETSRAVDLIEGAGAFVVNVLSAGQHDVARWFADQHRPPRNVRSAREIAATPGGTGQLRAL